MALKMNTKLKVLAAGSSGIVPVSAYGVAARSIWADQILVILLDLFVLPVCCRKKKLKFS